MSEENRFEGIEVYKSGNLVVSRNAEGRVLFRFNRISSDFGVFRSKRMTEAEAEFCLMMYERLSPEYSKEKADHLIEFIRYETDSDVFCS
jgi:hypothetical protein